MGIRELREKKRQGKEAMEHHSVCKGKGGMWYIWISILNGCTVKDHKIYWLKKKKTALISHDSVFWRDSAGQSSVGVLRHLQSSGNQSWSHAKNGVGWMFKTTSLLMLLSGGVWSDTLCLCITSPCGHPRLPHGMVVPDSCFPTCDSPSPRASTTWNQGESRKTSYDPHLERYEALLLPHSTGQKQVVGPLR